MTTNRTIRAGALASLTAVVLATGAHAQEAVIRKSIAERVPNIGKIDEVTRMPVPGLWEVRVGNEVFYTDEQANYLIEGSVIDLRARKNLTEERVQKLSAIDFASLPLKDAIVWKQGNGQRRMVVFADPNCGYCKRFEKSLNDVKDVTVYTFLYPILGPDSTEKSRAIWCSKDTTKVWRSWMLEGTPPPRTMGACDTSAIERNVALGRKHRVTGTPAIVFENGVRVPGAIDAGEVEKMLVAAKDAK